MYSISMYQQFSYNLGKSNDFASNASVGIARAGNEHGTGLFQDWYRLGSQNGIQAISKVVI